MEATIYNCSLAYFYVLDLLVLLFPILLGFARGARVGVRSSVLLLPVIISHVLLIYYSFGCGHGSGYGGVCDYLTLLMFAPKIFVLILFVVIYVKTEAKDNHKE